MSVPLRTLVQTCARGRRWRVELPQRVADRRDGADRGEPCRRQPHVVDPNPVRACLIGPSCRVGGTASEPPQTGVPQLGRDCRSHLTANVLPTAAPAPGPGDQQMPPGSWSQRHSAGGRVDPHANPKPSLSHSRRVRTTRQKLARKSARFAHRLPSDELASCATGTKSLQMCRIFRVEERAREDSNL